MRKPALWKTIPSIAAKWERPQEKKPNYGREAREFVNEAIARGETCPVVNSIPELKNGRRYGYPISNKLNEVHHMRGRRGKLLMDKRFWMAVSLQGHRFIHSHPKEAREKGWICPLGKWNCYEE